MRNSKVSVIDWRQSKRGDLIAFEDGKILDSPDDKIEMSQISNKKQIVVIGLGSGFLLNQIIKAYPENRVTVIECREPLLSAKKKQYPHVNFVVVHSIEELMIHSEYKNLLSVEVEKLLFKRSAGSQLSFFQEIFWNLNLRTNESLSQFVEMVKPIDDRWLINAKQLLDSANHDSIPYKKAELLIIQELMK